MKKSLISTSILAAIIAPTAAFSANDISYNYIEGNAILQNIDAYEDNDVFDDFVEDVDDGDGFGIEASYAFHDMMFVFGSYTETESDFTFVGDTGFEYTEGQDIKTLTAGLGYFKEINYQMDFVARAAYTDLDVGDFNLGEDENDFVDGDEDLGDAIDDLDEDTSDGFFVDAGVRSQTMDWLELGAGVRYTDIDMGDDFSLFGNALIEINQNMGINLAVNLGDDLSTYSAGFRYSF